MEIVTSWIKGIEQGLKQGRQEGRQEGELRLLLRLLTKTLGTLPSEIQHQMQGLTETQLEELCDRLPTLTSLSLLSDWIETQNTSEEI